ncbi:hypothetical protein QQ045_023155 [Rhodiola kirilowii]
MEEMQKVEKLGASLIEFANNFQFSMEGDKEESVVGQANELGDICKRLDEGLLPLQKQIREVFHRMVRSRTEILELLDQATKAVATLVPLLLSYLIPIRTTSPQHDDVFVSF